MKLITILLMAFALKSCGNSKAMTNSEDNTNMKQTEILSGTYSIKLIINNKELAENAHLTFDKTTNRVSGFVGCNNFSGNYSIHGDVIKFGAMISTKRLCKRFMDVDQNALKALEQTSIFSLKDNVLYLKSGDLILIEASKKSDINNNQDEGYSIIYTAETRGSYKMVSVKNNTLRFSTQRGAEPFSRICSEEELKAISEKLNDLELDKLPTLAAPSEGRYTDRAAIGKFKIINNGMTYEVPQFDDGNPNEYIADLLKAINSMMEKH